VPFVRFSRDRRGYEHVYLIDSPNDRGRSRVLYWFRTPPGIKVGRNPFDDETQRWLEERNPGVKFDWEQIVAARIPPPAPVENWREKRRAERAFKRARAEESAAEPEVAAPQEQEAPEEPMAAELEPNELIDVESALTASIDAENVDAGQPGTAVQGEGQRTGKRRRRRRGRRRPDQLRPGTPETRMVGNGPLDPPGEQSEGPDEG
jgi:hypothetical protein